MIFGALSAALVVLLLSGVLAGATPEIVDTDGFMRTVRVAELIDGEVGWWDGTAGRSNAPFGHTMHWTRPLDALIVAISGFGSLAVDGDAALEFAALVAGPAVFAVTAAALAWAAMPLVGRVGAVVAALGVSLQPALFEYGAVGRVDHHGLIFLASVGLLGFGLRLARDPTDSQAAMSAGIVAGVGLWVSTEFLLPVALFLVAFLVAWIFSGSPTAQVMRAFSASWTLTTAVALIIERAPDMASSRDLDRISAVHLLVAALAFAFWMLVSIRRPRSWRGRAALAGGASVVTGLVLWVAVPGFAAGPFGDVPPVLWEAWLSTVAELQPLWPIGANPGRTVYVMAAPLLAIPIVAIAARRDARNRPVWLAVGVILVGLTGLGFFQARFSASAQLVATLAWGWLSAMLVARIGDQRTLGASIRRIGAMLAGIAGFLVPVFIAVPLLADDTSVSTTSNPCEFDALVTVIDEQGGESIVLTHIDWGPEILYRTEASVLATPYHRNVDGILDARRFLASSPETAATIARARSIDLVAVCPPRDAAYLGDDRSDGDMLERLATRQPPPWLVPVLVDSALRVYEVVPTQLP